ncbi:VWA containing CoxE family protein OS=Streptomyces glaucescens OX=1907 GN=SGLAU_02350 PE=4 SV=1 [Streptomyces glaucescens]
MTDHTTEEPPAASADENRRQVLYWRLLARLFDPEEQATLESASLAVVEDIGLPPALLDPQASVDAVVQRHPELAAEFDGLMVPEADGDEDRDRAAEVRRAALVSKVLLNVFASGSGTVTAGQLARWQSDAGWLERALGCRPGELRAGRAAGGAGRAAGGGVSPTGTKPASRPPTSARSSPRSGPNSAPSRPTWSSGCICVKSSPTPSSPHS